MIPWPQQPILNTPAEVTAWEQTHSGTNYIDQHGQAVIRSLPPGFWKPDGRPGIEVFVPVYPTTVNNEIRTFIFRAGTLYRHAGSYSARVWQLNAVGQQVIADLATLLPSTAKSAAQMAQDTQTAQRQGMSAADLRILGEQIQELILNAAFCIEHGSTSWKKRP